MKDPKDKRCMLILELKPFRSRSKQNIAQVESGMKIDLQREQEQPVQPIQINIYQSNTYRKELSWLHFDNEPRV